MESDNLLPDGEISHPELKMVRFAEFHELEYSRIISAISHDISNPVAILKSNIQLLKTDFNKNEIELNREILSMCDESAEELVRFLENIRMINLSMKSIIRPKIALFKIADILNNQFLDIEKLSLNSKRISILTNSECTEVSSDLDFLRQITLNLLTNALKFSRTEVKLCISLIESNIEIVVQDFGIGIPENEIEEVFNPFFRGSNVKKAPGMGLGLAIVKSLTKSLGGQIFLSSLITQGTIIRIVIPNEHAN
jgi:signal transduction histidine kinase